MNKKYGWSNLVSKGFFSFNLLCKPPQRKIFLNKNILLNVYSETFEFNAYQIEIESNRIETNRIESSRKPEKISLCLKY